MICLETEVVVKSASDGEELDFHPFGVLYKSNEPGKVGRAWLYVQPRGNGLKLSLDVDNLVFVDFPELGETAPFHVKRSSYNEWELTGAGEFENL